MWGSRPLQVAGPGMEESPRKFAGAIRKYLLLYMKVHGKTPQQFCSITLSGCESCDGHIGAIFIGRPRHIGGGNKGSSDWEVGGCPGVEE